MGSSSYRFYCGNAKQEDVDTICTIVDKATKMCHFLSCNESIIAKEVVVLYWRYVGKLHGIPSVIIFDRDPHFTGQFWRELLRLLALI